LHEDPAGGPILNGVSLMSASMVVEVERAFQCTLPLGHAREETASELDAPKLLQDGPMRPLHEAARSGVARLGAGLAATLHSAGLLEATAESVALVGQYPLRFPARLVKGWQDMTGQEASRGPGRELQANLGQAVRASSVGGRVLPHLAYALELADAQGVQTDQVPGWEAFRWGVWRRSAAGTLVKRPAAWALCELPLPPSAPSGSADRLGATGG